MGVGVIPVSRGSGRENLAVGAQLHMVSRPITASQGKRVAAGAAISFERR